MLENPWGLNVKLLLLLVLVLRLLSDRCCCCCCIAVCVAARYALYQCLLGLTCVQLSAVATAWMIMQSCWGLRGRGAPPSSRVVDKWSKSPHKL
jgi:hypothetical protein